MRVRKHRQRRQTDRKAERKKMNVGRRGLGSERSRHESSVGKMGRMNEKGEWKG